jgi:hypothetical protein
MDVPMMTDGELRACEGHRNENLKSDRSALTEVVGIFFADDLSLQAWRPRVMWESSWVLS